MVRTRTRGGSGSAVSCRVASMPSMPRHPDVHQDDVGAGPRGSVDRRRAVAGLADDVEVGLGVDHHAEPGAHQRLVVDEDDADRRWSSSRSHG